MKYEIIKATKEDREEILTLYKKQIGQKFCPWDDHYPSMETIDFDLSRESLFILKEEGQIKAAISIDQDEAVDTLPYWDEKLSPSGELARLAVLPDDQGKGIGRSLFLFGMEELKRRGFRGIHILVNKENRKAIQCYKIFDFCTVGTCHLYEQDFLCYEKRL